MGPEDPSNRKKYPSFFVKQTFWKLQDISRNESLKIGSKGPQKLGPFFSLFLMRKPLSIGSNAMLMFSFNCVMIHCLVAYLQYYCTRVVKPKIALASPQSD